MTSTGRESGQAECKRHGPYNKADGCGPCEMLKHEFSGESGQETPRTDQAVVDWTATDENCVSAKFARSLEIELTAARAQIAEREERIKVLEKAVEHAEYMAKAGEFFQKSLNDEFAARPRRSFSLLGR